MGDNPLWNGFSGGSLAGVVSYFAFDFLASVVQPSAQILALPVAFIVGANSMLWIALAAHSDAEHKRQREFEVDVRNRLFSIDSKLEVRRRTPIRESESA
jgi:hypothetical protein